MQKYLSAEMILGVFPILTIQKGQHELDESEVASGSTLIATTQFAQQQKTNAVINFSKTELRFPVPGATRP